MGWKQLSQSQYRTWCGGTAFNHSTLRAEAAESLQIQGQREIHSESENLYL